RRVAGGRVGVAVESIVATLIAGSERVTGRREEAEEVAAGRQRELIATLGIGGTEGDDRSAGAVKADDHGGQPRLSCVLQAIPVAILPHTVPDGLAQGCQILLLPAVRRNREPAAALLQRGRGGMIEKTQPPVVAPGAEGLNALVQGHTHGPA